MIYANLSGRLGNQLFYYAIARKLQIDSQVNHSLCFNTFYVKKNGDIKDGFEDTLKYFNVKEYSTECVSRLKMFRHANLLQKFLLILYYSVVKFSKYFLYKRNKEPKMVLRFYKYLSKKHGLYVFPHYLNSVSHQIKLEGSSSKNLFVEGRYENSNWFNDIKPILLEEIKPKKPMIKSNIDLYKVISSSNSICVSIRRGDYWSKEYRDIFGICDKDYFKKAIDKMNSMVDNPAWIVFSDDIAWAKESKLFSKLNNVYFESGNDPVWEKLRLMYSCKHFIISNSTFSWWAQYLSTNNNKIVISPDKWLNFDGNWPLIEDNFIKIHCPTC